LSAKRGKRTQSSFYVFGLVKSPSPPKKWPAEGRALPAEYWLYGSTTNFGDFGRLRPFRTLNNLKLNLISFLKRAIAIAGDGGIMNENVWAIIAPDEAIPFGIIEPLDSSLQRLPPE
jgi:hypothetical protein